MLRSLYCPPAGAPKTGLSLEEICVALEKSDGLLWVSLEDTAEPEINSVLHDIFHFHPLAIEDCLSTGYQTPKIDDFGTYIFMITHAVGPAPDFETIELNAFLGEKFLVTSYLGSRMSPIAATWKHLLRDERMANHGADFLLHGILDILVDEVTPLIDEIDEEIEILEDEVLGKPRPPVLQRILSLKHRIMALRRIIGPQREVMNRLSRDDFPQISPQSRIYYRDIYDHLVRIQDMTESIRDLISGSLDIYLSATSNRLNEVMKALTIVSTIFLPLSFVAGVYGMNFQFMPELSWKYGYLAIWGVFILIVSGMLAFFRKRGWI
jgi:magnesium transporter